jgi:hypothetical protein
MRALLSLALWPLRTLDRRPHAFDRHIRAALAVCDPWTDDDAEFCDENRIELEGVSR